jgi:CubicO group peptidase (beta-lactamase class C family)
VEITANEPFQTFMQDELFKPLQMDNTVLYQRGLNQVKNRAYGHAKQNGKWVRADQSVSSATRGDGVVYTSLEDIQKWMFAHAQRKILNENSQREMFSPQVKTTRGDSSYGFGWFIDEYHDTRRFHHNGDTRGFRLCVQAFPDQLAAIVLQFNGEVDQDMTKVGERLADVLIFDREQSLTNKPVTANRAQPSARP